MVELRDRQGGTIPGLAPVPGQADTTIVADDHSLGVLLIDPHVVVVPAATFVEDVFPPSVVLSSGTWGKPDRVRVGRVDGEGGVVPGPLAERAVALTRDQLSPPSSERNSPPFSASMSAYTRPGLVGRHPHPHLAPDPIGETLTGEPRPGVAAVARDRRPLPGRRSSCPRAGGASARSRRTRSAGS